MKYCKDCKFVRPDWVTTIISFGISSCWEFSKCLHKESAILGSECLAPKVGLSNKHYCTTMRSSARLCGEKGQYFEAKK